MKPYYEHNGITIYHGDCREILPEIGKVDLVLTDPPYGLNFKMNGGTWGIKYGHSDMAKWDYVVSQETIELILNKGITAIVWGANHYVVPASRCWLVWEKPFMPTLSDCELAYTNIDAPAKSYNHNRESSKYHPTEKPLLLMKWCIDIADKHHIAGTILDPFMGSGTTLVAAKQLGRRAIGIELEEKYCEIAAKRLGQEVFNFE